MSASRRLQSGGTAENALQKTVRRVALADGKVTAAFDELDVGVSSADLADWFQAQAEPRFGALTGPAFGAALTVAMLAVEADRRTQRAEPPADGEWTRDAAWQLELHRVWEMEGATPGEEPVAWRKTPLQVLMGREAMPGETDLRWHLSVAHKDRIPSWEELVDAAHALRPGVPFCLGLPPRSWWLNYDERVLHLWEVRDAALIEAWRQTPGGQDPT